MVKTYFYTNYTLHASFIQCSGYCDNFVSVANAHLAKYKKDEYIRSRPDFRMWFTYMNGNAVTVQNFKSEMMLEYI